MSCIYKIVNKITGMMYIGQTTTTIKHRWGQHKSCINKKTNLLYIAFAEWGIDNFYIEEIISGDFDKNKLNELEKFYIKELNTFYPNGYNLQTGGNDFTVSDFVSEKMSQKFKGREITWKKQVSEGMKKRWQDPIYREKMIKAHSHPIGKYKKHTKPLRLNLPIDEINELYKNGMNINAISKKFGVCYSAIKKRIKGDE